MLEVMRRLLLRTPEAAEGRLCLLGVLEMPEVMRCVLLCLLGLWRVGSVCCR